MTSNAQFVRVSRSTSIALTLGLAVALTAVRSHAQPAPAEQPGAAQPPAASPAPAPDNPTAAPAEAQPADAAPSEVPAGAAQPEAAPSEPTEAYSPPPAAAEESEASADAEADLAAELAASEIAAEAQSQGPKLDVYGFADFTYARRLTNHTSDILMPALPTFYVGNFNLYLGAKLDRWRSLSEVRFTYLPDGAVTFDQATGAQNRISTAYGDYSDWNRSKKVGGVIIERAWLEYSAHSLLTIRGGQFLTPYGIWNVDHGSPVVIGTTRPYIVGNEWLPSHQTGLEVYGSQGFNRTQLGYHLTLSNGRGPIDTYQDLDKNKALGWRLWAKQDTPIGTFGLGTSGYRGRYTDSATAYDFATSEAQTTVTSRYDELALAGDFKWTWGEYLLQSEAIVQDVRYDDRFRPRFLFAPQGSPPAWTPDQRVWGYYVLTGYRLPWWGVMPFVLQQYQDWGKGHPITSWEFSGGLNIRPNEMVVFKVATLWLYRPNPGSFSKNEGQLSAQAAWSF